MRDDLMVTDLVTCARGGDKQAWDALVERFAPLIWCICRRYRLGGADAEDVGQNVWLQPSGSAGQDQGSGGAARLAGNRDPAGMHAGPAHGPRTPRCRVCAGCRDHPGRSGFDGRPGTARGGASRCAPRGIRPPVPVLPAANRRPDRGPSRAVHPDQCQVGHPSRKHRAHSQPLPEQAAPLPGHRGADRRRSRTTGNSGRLAARIQGQHGSGDHDCPSLPVAGCGK